MQKLIAFVMAVVLFFCGAVPGSTKEKAEKFRTVAYLVVPAVSKLDDLDTSHFKDLTDVIIFSAAGMNGDGEVVLYDGFDEIVSRLKAMDTDDHLRWQLNLDIICEKDQKLELRDAFRGKVLPANIRKTLEAYDLDGVFFDYEFPQEWDAKLDFSIFLIHLDKALGDDFCIGAALQPWCARFLPGAVAAIDMVELMCYDNWDADGFHSTMELAKQDVRDMLKLGYKLRQIDLGLPFYARPTTKEARWYDYREYWDKIDEKGLAVEERTGLIASFNTPELIYEKTKWAIETGIGGVMVWHYDCDIPADNDKSLFNAVARARTACIAQDA